MNWLSQNKKLIWISCIAFTLRFALLVISMILNPDAMWTYDSYGYWQLGHNIIHHEVFSQAVSPPLEPDYFRTPLYPLFLALFENLNIGNSFIVFCQVILSTLICIYTYKLSKTISPNEKIALLAGLIMALDIPSIVFANFILTETLFSLLLVISIFHVSRFIKHESLKDTLYSAAFLGLATLCRPIAFPVVFIVGVVLFLMTLHRAGYHRFSILFFLFFFTVIISPWLIRNKLTFGEFFISHLGEHVLMNIHAGAIVAAQKGISPYEAEIELRSSFIRTFNGNAVKCPNEFANHIQIESQKIIFENFGVFLKLHLKAGVLFFVKPVRGYIDLLLGKKNTYAAFSRDISSGKGRLDSFHKYSGRFTVAMVYLQIIFSLVVYIGFAIGIAFLFREKMYYTSVLFLGTLACFASTVMPSWVEARFRIPVMPMVAVISAAGLLLLKEIYTKRKK